ncbi:MAG: hypothetical protein RLZZ78_1107 [Armatimonadota bacterium]
MRRNGYLLSVFKNLPSVRVVVVSTGTCVTEDVELTTPVSTGIRSTTRTLCDPGDTWANPELAELDCLGMAIKVDDVGHSVVACNWNLCRFVSRRSTVPNLDRMHPW